MAVGIIAEYNPFHNGHLYHLNKIKEMFPNETIVLVMSGNFTERGDISIIDKWDKTEIALNNNINLVIELPFCYTIESADIFSYGAINLLKELKVDKLVFGSEINDIDKLTTQAKIQLTDEYNELVKKNMNSDINYPTASSNALKELNGIEINTPNDILGVSYIREIIKQKAKITPFSIKRTNDYHSKELFTIASATSIRNALSQNKDIKEYVPKDTLKYINNKNIEDYFILLKYKILSEEDLTIYQGVDESINSRIKKYINKSNSIDELILHIKNKKYTYSKIKRSLICILCNYTKKEALKNKEYNYIRVLGFDLQGQKYLNTLKKEINVPIITNYKEIYNDFLKLESKVTNLYYINEKDKNLIRLEHITKPIIR